MEFLKKVDAYFDRFLDIQAFAACVMLIFMMLLTCYEIIARYIFQTSPAWVLEICEYILLYVTFLGAAWLLKKDGHVKVDIVFSLLSLRSRWIVTIIICVLGALASLFITWYGTVSALDHFRRGIEVIQTLNTPKWILLLIIPLGSLMLFIQLLRQIFVHLSEGIEPKEKSSSGI